MRRPEKARRSLLGRFGRIAALGSTGVLLGLAVTMAFVGAGPTLSGLEAAAHRAGDRLAVLRWESLPVLSLSPGERDALWNAALATAIEEGVTGPSPSGGDPIPLWSARLDPSFVPRVPGRELMLLAESEIRERAQARGECPFLGVGLRGYSWSAVRVEVYSSIRFRGPVTHAGGSSVVMDCGGWWGWKCTVVEQWIS